MRAIDALNRATEVSRAKAEAKRIQDALDESRRVAELEVREKLAATAAISTLEDSIDRVVARGAFTTALHFNGDTLGMHMAREHFISLGYNASISTHTFRGSDESPEELYYILTISWPTRTTMRDKVYDVVVAAIIGAGAGGAMAGWVGAFIGIIIAAAMGWRFE